MGYLKSGIILVAALLLLFIGYLAGINKSKLITNTHLPLGIENRATDKPLDIYTIENLSQSEIQAGDFELESNISSNESYNSHKFSLTFHPNPKKSYKKKTTGLINIPTDDKKMPIIVMLRGYVDQEIYKTGMGTVRASEIFAENGFITVAPDFLGYAGSDKEAENIFESRFQTYVTTLSLIKSLYQINEWDNTNIFLWGHSNGGQIALTVLEISGKDYPTSLWAPVSKSFPYSILYYTDEAEDRGKLIRGELAKFENDYDVELYSLDNYFERINAPIQIHQGTADDAVPINWTDSLYQTLLDLNPPNGEASLDPNFFTYPGADHNMRPSWDTVVKRNLDFFRKNVIN